jgi:predicted nucleic-acid-binding protein
MFAVDTSVLIRLFVDDDHGQHRQATEYFMGLGESQQVYVGLVVITDVVWVLKSRLSAAPP